MHILIIGGTRFCGPGVVKRLAKQGHQVTLFHRGQSNFSLPPGVSEILGDRGSIAEFGDQFRQSQPDLVLDMFPISEDDAKIVLSIFSGVAKRIVALSSQDVYRAYSILLDSHASEIEPIPLTEDSPLRDQFYPYRADLPDDHRLYNYDKILVERVYMNCADINGTILRLPMVYGPGDYQHRLFPYLKRMDDNRPIILEQGLADWRWTKIYVDEASAAVALAVTDQRAAGRIYNVGEKETLTEAKWVAEIGNAAGWSGEIVTVPSEEMPKKLLAPMNLKQHFVSDSRRLSAELGYQASVSRAQALLETIAWERDNPPDEITPDQFDYTTEDALLKNLRKDSTRPD